MTEYDHEPIRGLPGDLPPGEQILWQSAPDWRTFVRSALFARPLMVYFAALTLLAVAGGNLFGAAVIAAAGVVLQGLLALFAVLVARTTVYTLTNRRIVLRIGVALNKCINLPLSQIAAADLRPRGQGHGDIALTLLGRHRLGYAMLWPHARPLRLSRPQPMLRAMPDAARLAETLARACAAAAPEGVTTARTAPAARPAATAGDPGLQGVAA
ncbi:photosynthetic complex putative assembly protein PuhB [Novosphingobium piscinae]|uniref:PH domain-containing protein n=1 Tax=Novosphingobium piscinae TaxID=1507448 RepID=A0A7X1FX75_9SPHN|nr:photosynthetic complex putative assembly protein PuhB [Novosphingobium piscinae]MBC2668529.1 PH domain-containing protein [Novosphingobium piscinae]